ncbi:MAG: Ig domain-containing protein, partial [Acidobacteriota bacterium]|nr:Ig domain-containing protein [Acidobacteriota bacterium]
PNGLNGTGAANLDANPWLTLTLTAMPASVMVGGTSTLTAKLTINSDGVDTALLPMPCFVPDNTPVSFASAGRGTVMPPTEGTVNGVANSTYTGELTGNDTVSATVDGQTVSTGIMITCAPVTGTVSGGTGEGMVCVGQPSTVTVTVSGGTGPYTVILTNGGGTQTGFGPIFDFIVSPTMTTTYMVAAMSHDVSGCPITNSGSATVMVKPTPTCTISGANPVNMGTTHTYTGTSTMPGSSFDWMISGNGTLSGPTTNPTVDVIAGAPGSYTLTLTVMKDGCSSTCTFTVTVSCQAITVTAPVTNSGVANAAFSQTFTQSGGIGTTTFSKTGALPTGISLSSAGVLSGTPTQTGTFPITVTATDSNGCTGMASYTLTITCQTITVTNPTTNTGTAGAAFSQTFTQSGGIGTTAFSTASTLPTGLTLMTNGTLSGTPTQTGTFMITVKATDSNGCMGTGATYTLTITCQTITVTNPATNTGTAGAAFSQTFTQAGSIGTTTFSTASTLPTGLSLSNGGVLSGTPTQTGTFMITVKATDSNGCMGTGATYTLTINCQPITVTNPATNTSTAGAAFSQTFTQSGGIGTTTFSKTGTLPTGLTLSSAGLLSGTPTQTGVFMITVKATDSNNCMGTGAIYTLTINCQTITISPATIPGAFKGAPYSQTFTAAGAVGAVTWSVSAGSLPAGLTLSSAGVLSGTPGAIGNFTFTVKVTDANNCPGMQTYTLPVNEETMVIADPFACTGPGNLVNVTATVTNNAVNAQAASFTATLTPSLRALPGSCTASIGACSVVSFSMVTWIGTLNAGQTVTINYQAQVNDGELPGAQLCATSVATVGNSLPATVTACGVVNCPLIGPGTLPASTSPMSDQKAGSVLIYNVYTSSSNPTQQNTRISLTNINPALPAFVHLFFVDGTSCSVADSILCLTPNQTTSFLASDLDPGSTGYIVAIAVDANGCPTNFNFLIGDEYVKFASGHAANLGAEAITAIAGGLPFCDTNSTTATLSFDGVSYNVVPRVLALDNIPSRADGNDTLLILNRIGGNLATGASTLGSIFGILYDDSENALSFSITGGCQLRSSLSNTFPRTTPRFEQFIPAGRSGWLKLFSQSDIGISGAAINFNANSGTTAGAFNQGHNLHKLTNTSTANYTIPVFPPGC